MTTNTGLTLVQETIAFQPKDFGKRLEATVQEILDSGLTAAKIDAKYGTILNGIVKDFTKLNVWITFNTNMEPAGLPMVMHNNHPLVNNQKSYSASDARAIVNYVHNVKRENTVSIKSATVSGIYSKMETRVFFSYDIIKGFGLTPAEVTAILLHEIGHIFTYFEYQNRFATSNQVLQSLLMSSRNDPVETYTYVYKTAAQIITGDKNAFDSLQYVKDSNVITTLVVDKTVEALTSQTGSPFNDSVSSEQLADAFAARFGYARPLITGMEKLYTMGQLDKRGALRNSLLAVEIGALVVAGISLISLTNPILLTAVAALYLSALFKVSSKVGANKRESYDDTRVRYLRIKEQVVEEIKNRKLPTEEIKKLVEDIDAIDKFVDEYADSAYKPLVEQAINFIFRSHRNAADVIKLQRTLEELASNDLFIRAAELSTLKVKKA